MKYLYLSLMLTVSTLATAQIKATSGNNSADLIISKQPEYTTFSTPGADYFVITRTEGMLKVKQLVVADKSGAIISSKDVLVDAGIFNNINTVTNLVVAGNTPWIFIENHNKAEGKNTLTAKAIGKDGKASATGTEVGSIAFLKMSDPGDWYVSLTPDKKHIAVISKLPHVKDAADQFKYFVFDENLKQTATGDFSFAGNTKKIPVFDFLASDKGDFYIISEEYDKSYKYPVLYKFSIGGQATIIPVMIADPATKNFSYTSKVSPSGDLIIAGYTIKKSTFSAGDPQTLGTWIFNSAKINEVKTYNFDKPVTNLTARNILFNDDTFFLVGEQYLKDKIKNNATGMQRLGMDDEYNYTHNDIEVTGFTAAGEKKFDIPMSRQGIAKEFDQEYMLASGIINGKLAIIYNDQYGKYFDDRYYKNYKLPVATLVTNDGLMEAPVNFAKELDVKVSTYTLFPQFFANDGKQITILSGNANSVKTIVFK